MTHEEAYAEIHTQLYFRLGEWDVTFEMLYWLSSALKQTCPEVLDAIDEDRCRAIARGVLGTSPALDNWAKRFNLIPVLSPIPSDPDNVDRS